VLARSGGGLMILDYAPLFLLALPLAGYVIERWLGRRR
jgi:hypothetical protein